MATVAARGGGAASALSVVAGAAVLAAPVNTEVKEASAGEIATSATAVDSVTTASTAAVLQRAKVAVWEMRTSARAQILTGEESLRDQRFCGARSSFVRARN